MLPETLGELLNVSLAVGLVVSLFLSKLQVWENLSSEQKQHYIKWLSVGIGLVITLVNTFIPEASFLQAGEWYAVLRPLLNMLFATIGGTFAASQVTHGAYRWLLKKGDA